MRKRSPNHQMHRTATPRCSFGCIRLFGRWIRCRSPLPVVVGDLGRSEYKHMRNGFSLALALLMVGCSGNYTLDRKSFTAEKLKMVEQRTGLSLPVGSRGLNMFYKGEPMDPFFLARVEIPEASHDELLTRIDRLRNEEIHISGSPTKNFDWWRLSKETTKAERQFTLNGDYVHVALCNENGHWILYLEWFTV